MKKEAFVIKEVVDYIKKGFIDKNKETSSPKSVSSKIYFVQKQNKNWFYLAIIQDNFIYYMPSNDTIDYFNENNCIKKGIFNNGNIDGIFAGNIPDKDKVISELKNINEDIIIDYDDFEEGDFGDTHFSVIAISYLNSIKDSERYLKLTKDLVEVSNNIESYRVAISDESDEVIAVSKNAINKLLNDPKYFDICLTLLNNTKTDALKYKERAVEYELCFKNRMSVTGILPSELQLYLEVNDF